jgi:hypothetical protein
MVIWEHVLLLTTLLAVPGFLIPEARLPDSMSQSPHIFLGVYFTLQNWNADGHCLSVT